ncbi:malto-oligosyltrehalose synthase [candidate division GN15 bacterium]|nr:malto-oligosyltrehalose synthase [candidate division GN15 bacterium]
MRIPRATYRLQLNPSFGFEQAEQIVDYLAQLGVSDIYASPIFNARSGSTHGYDVVDPRQLNPELGSQQDFHDLVTSLGDRDLGWVQDIVPNHMAIDPDNTMLMDVLEVGASSPYYDFFEIDWDHPYENMHGRLLLPLLGKFYSECLADGEIKLGYDESGFTINYYQIRLPLRIDSYTEILEYSLGTLEESLGSNHPDYVKFLGSVHFHRSITNRKDDRSLYQQIRHAKRLLWQLYDGNERIRTHVDAAIDHFNGDLADRSSFDALDHLLSQQLFRLSFWKVASEEINYRRFFTVNDLICLRVEKERVLEETHQLVLELVGQGTFTGLRIDHIDGLYDPKKYLDRLRSRIGETYLVVEKILEAEEHLPENWPVQGTTGYDQLDLINGVFCKVENRSAFTKLYFRFTGLQQAYDDILHEKISLIIHKHMAGNIDNLAQFLKTISGHDRYGQDITLYGLRRALVEVMAHFPVYRTYMSKRECSEDDRRYVRHAIQQARERNPDLLYEFNFIEKYLLLEMDDSVSEDDRRKWIHFVMAFQQYTGPLMAKGFEDTMMYVYNRLLSLNDVGGNPNLFGHDLKSFHAFQQYRHEAYPHAMTTTSTHDTKRGEDVRARINVLSEMPDEWERRIKQFARINRGRKRRVRGSVVPDKNDEYFLYQTLLGVWPGGDIDTAFIERIKQYVIKAVREAKVHTAWIKPDSAYEDAYLAFVGRILSTGSDNAFLDEFIPFQQRVAAYGIWNSLSQLVVKMTVPGVPDIYQGCELWDLTLVDPDNRRPVDFSHRKLVLDDLVDRQSDDPAGLLSDLLESRTDGRIKLYLTHRLLQLRNESTDLFTHGAYVPVEITGERAVNVVAYARRHDDAWAITVVPRFTSEVIGEDEVPIGESVWGDTEIVLPEAAPGQWQNAFSGESVLAGDGRLRLAEILDQIPAAVLTN